MNESKDNVLIGENIFHKYEENVLVIDGVSLEVARGSAVAIVGSSGEGKSTLLHILGTLLNPTSGDIYICGQKVSNTNADFIRKTYIGFVFQFFFLLDDCSVIDNILLAAKVAKKACGKRSATYSNALNLLENFSLIDKRKQMAGTLSGGERQRVAIARALCNDPQVIFADEPTGNLDHKTSHAVFELLVDQSKKFGKSLVVSTHDIALSRLCDKVYCLEEGEFV